MLGIIWNLSSPLSKKDSISSDSTSAFQIQWKREKKNGKNKSKEFSIGNFSWKVSELQKTL